MDQARSTSAQRTISWFTAHPRMGYGGRATTIGQRNVRIDDAILPLNHSPVYWLASSREARAIARSMPCRWCRLRPLFPARRISCSVWPPLTQRQRQHPKPRKLVICQRQAILLPAFQQPQTSEGRTITQMRTRIRAQSLLARYAELV